jgi:hypothetical protein
MIGMGVEASTIVRAKAADFFCDICHICVFLKYATRQSFKYVKFMKCHEK